MNFVKNKIVQTVAMLLVVVGIIVLLLGGFSTIGLNRIISGITGILSTVGLVLILLGHKKENEK